MYSSGAIRPARHQFPHARYELEAPAYVAQHEASVYVEDHPRRILAAVPPVNQERKLRKVLRVTYYIYIEKDVIS